MMAHDTDTESQSSKESRPRMKMLLNYKKKNETLLHLCRYLKKCSCKLTKITQFESAWYKVTSCSLGQNNSLLMYTWPYIVCTTICIYLLLQIWQVHAHTCQVQYKYYSISSCCVNKNANVAQCLYFLTSVIIKHEKKSAKGSKERIKHKKS